MKIEGNEKQGKKILPTPIMCEQPSLVSRSLPPAHGDISDNLLSTVLLICLHGIICLKWFPIITLLENMDIHDRIMFHHKILFNHSIL